MSTTQPGLAHCSIIRVAAGEGVTTDDLLTVEEPLEIRIGSAQLPPRSLAVTMRTPGQDAELATGFLFTEGIVGQADQILSVRHCGDALHPLAQENVLLVTLRAGLAVALDQLTRHFYTSSSCGVCGKASIELVRTVTCYYPRAGHPQVGAPILHRLPHQLRAAQSVFEQTGGIHAAGLFDSSGQLLLLREDVGRHNALDKLIGAALRAGMLPLRDQLLLVSGRLSFELVQKAAMAGIPIVGAVGAPSSLAVQLAEEHGMTLVGFLRQDRFNVYCGAERIRVAASD